jgi:hypothetical protein
MKLVVPYVGEFEAADANLIRLAEFLGITCEPLLLEKGDENHVGHIEEASRGQANCFVVNPRVIKEWTRGSLPRDLTSCLASYFPFLFVHSLTTDLFSQSLTRALSGDRLQTIQPIADSSSVYEIASNTRKVCGPFSGTSFGPVNPLNDHVFSVTANKVAVLAPISIGGKPFMAIAKQDKTEILFLASAHTLDVNSAIADKPLSEYFSRFVPHAMALRYVFGDQCWHPIGHCASFTIDDPLLRPKYGDLDFEALLNLMKDNNFSTTIAFIPHNYRRSAERTVRLFQQNSGRLSICFHGNDHTAAEFASTDVSLLNTMTEIAEARMSIHAKATGIPCNKVMVFPQDSYSLEAMNVLKSRNFFAAVSEGFYLYGGQADFTLGELAQPAIVRYGGFPLFLRKSIGRFKREDIAYDLFVGKPALICEHHGVFRQAEPLIEAVRSINSIAPDVRWCNLATAVANSNLTRKTSDGVCHIRAYSGTIHISNDSDNPQRFVVEWNHSDVYPSVEHVLEGEIDRPFEMCGSLVRLSVELPPRCWQTLSLVFRNAYPSLGGLGFQRSVRSFVRRRLSEVRDNFISKNPVAMVVAQSVKRRILSKVL